MDLIKAHEVLFSGHSQKLGQLHWYILKAGLIMETTDFGKEVGDVIRWWVFKKESHIEELLIRTEKTLIHVQKLKEDSFALKKGYFPESYEDLISKLKEFTESHKEEIDALYDYVVWLNQKDVVAPSILFAYRVWGSTRISNRSIRRLNLTTDEGSVKEIKKTTEIALGLFQRGYTLNSITSRISEEMSNYIDPEEYTGPISPPENKVIFQTSRRVLDDFSAYFEFLRQSLRNIILEIKNYKKPDELLKSEAFWRAFIKKAMDKYRIETPLWDFKKTFEMWHIRDAKPKKASQTKFCEQIAAYANADGGVMIVGIENAPRNIIGIEDLENKVKSTKLVIRNHIKYDTEFTHLQQVLMTDDDGKEVSCLVIAIAQTKDVISVKDEQGRFSYPRREGTGLERRDKETIIKSKAHVTKDNYEFISDLDKFTHEQ